MFDLNYSGACLDVGVGTSIQFLFPFLFLFPILYSVHCTMQYYYIIIYFIFHISKCQNAKFQISYFNVGTGREEEEKKQKKTNQRLVGGAVTWGRTGEIFENSGIKPG